jgi:hypothetical protein
MPDCVVVTLSPLEWICFLAGFALLGLSPPQRLIDQTSANQDHCEGSDTPESKSQWQGEEAVVYRLMLGLDHPVKEMHHKT